MGIFMNELTAILSSELCKYYEMRQGEEAIILKTPLRYDDGDYMVLFITPQADHTFLIDDNGDTSTRLMFEGVDLNNSLSQIWIKNACAIHQLQWDPERDAFWCKATRQNLIERIHRVAQVSIQMQAMVVLLSIPEELTTGVIEPHPDWRPEHKTLEANYPVTKQEAVVM